MGLTDTSKFLSLILRHKPETIEIKLDEHGWAAGMESLWCIGWQPERWQMKDLSFSYRIQD